MAERRFRVSDPQPGDNRPITMLEDELRQTYGFLIDVIDQEDFCEVVVIIGGRRIEVSEMFDPLRQHVLPR